MTRNVQSLGNGDGVLQGERLEPENPPTPTVDAEKSTVTFLRKLLNDVSIETMLQAVQRLNLSVHISSTGTGTWGAHIKGHGTLNYHAGGAKSPRMALVNAFAEFFINEQRDVHDYPNFGKEKDGH